MKAKFIAIAALATFTGLAAANDELYGQAQLGLDFFSKPQDGDWYQQTHDHNLNLSSYDANVGIGYRWDKWALETNYRYLQGGKITSDLEWDVTYGTSGNHAPVERTATTWNVRGPSIDVLRYFGHLYLRYGEMLQKQSWTIDVQSLKFQDVRSTQESTNTDLEPLIGIGYGFNKFVAEVTYYKMALGSGFNAVKSAMTLNIGVRF